MSKLISHKQRWALRDHLKYKLARYYQEKKGEFTFHEFMEFYCDLRSEAVDRHLDSKGKSRVPQYMWEHFYGSVEVLHELIEMEIEGGYKIFGKFYRHPGNKTYFPDTPTWQDLCPDDNIVRQELLFDSYVTVWKSTGKVYSEKQVPKFPSMAFYKEGPKNFRFDIVPEHNRHTITGSEPFQGKTMMYKKVLELMRGYKIPMQNVEEL